ncbi:50S ribosomal protein L18 [Patescibacteria group bacterium]|nr:50S ribosomal protein L18 [Patescibacteria group bacterium]
MLEKQEKRYRRHKRVRAKISGTSKVPRLCVFRSAKHIYAQLIDDEKGKTLVASGAQKIKELPRVALQAQREGVKNEEKEKRAGKVAIAFEVGKLIAKEAKKQKIEKVVFDRGGYRYHGRVKALAQGAREEGLKF